MREARYPDDPRVCDLRVTPYALDTYDALAKPKETRVPNEQLR